MDNILQKTARIVIVNSKFKTVVKQSHSESLWVYRNKRQQEKLLWRNWRNPLSSYYHTNSYPSQFNIFSISVPLCSNIPLNLTFVQFPYSNHSLHLRPNLTNHPITPGDTIPRNYMKIKWLSNKISATLPKQAVVCNSSRNPIIFCYI